MKNNYQTALANRARLVLIAATVILIISTPFVNAQSAAKSSMPPYAVNPGPEVAGVNHVLKATYIHTCLPSCSDFAVGAGDAIPLDALTTITCPAASGKTCTITDDAWIELENTSGKANPEALGFYLDSTDADFLYNGGAGTPDGGQYDGLAHKTAVATGVSSGKHTIQTLTYSVFGANASAWTAVYRVYVP
jgi:hypothetical protein